MKRTERKAAKGIEPLKGGGWAVPGISATELISINQAAALGMQRMRAAIWANPMDHIKIDIIDGKPGPWIKLYSPSNKCINGSDGQLMTIMMYDVEAKSFLPYTGPLPGSPEYLEAEAGYGAMQ